MLLDGTLAAAREGKVLKYKNPYTKRIIFLHPDTIRKVIMERKQRTKAEIPSVTVTRKDLAKHQYSVVKNKEGKGFILSKEGFKLSGLTGREVYIASVIINHERKNSHDTALLAEAIAAAAKRQAQIQAQREQTEEPAGG
jgi:ribosomal protein L13E